MSNLNLSQVKLMLGWVLTIFNISVLCILTEALICLPITKANVLNTVYSIWSTGCID